ncbi:MAG: IS1595 family transposase [Nitrospinae bacterium]|nr:IS1595 family transposase [Nitrospinota bacterium]
MDVGESYLGGLGAGSHGRHTITKAIVAIAVEMREQGFRRIRLRHVPAISGTHLTSFIVDVVTPGTALKTDGWIGYAPLQSLGFQHQVTVLPDSPDPAHVLMPGVHRIAALLKRGLLRTLQGRISKDHLLYYLDEFTFRFNRRSSLAHGLLFSRLISQSVQTEHTSTHDLIL